MSGGIFIPPGVEVGEKPQLTEGEFRARFVDVVKRAIEEESGELIRGLHATIAQQDRDIVRLKSRFDSVARRARHLELENRRLKREARR